jgi:hypothetical protein
MLFSLFYYLCNHLTMKNLSLYIVKYKFFSFSLALLLGLIGPLAAIADTATTTATTTDMMASTTPSLVLLSSNISPSTIMTGSTTNIMATIESQNASTSDATVEMTIFDPSGKEQHMTSFMNQALPQNIPITYNMTSSSSLLANNYHVWLSVFNNAHTQTLATFTNVGSFVVQDMATTSSTATSTATTTDNSNNMGTTTDTSTATSTTNTTATSTTTTTNGTTTPSMTNFTMSATLSASSTMAVSTPITIDAWFTNTGTVLNPGIADIEVYDSMSNKVFQQFFMDQNFGSTTQHYMATWTPTSTGMYTVKLGAFTNDWMQTIAWNNEAATTTIMSAVATSTATTTDNGMGTTTDNTGTTTPSTGTSTPMNTGMVTPNNWSVRQGTTVDFTGRGFGIEEPVTVMSDGMAMTTAHADGGGNFSTGSLNVPMTLGSKTYNFMGQNSGITGSATITITE